MSLKNKTIRLAHSNPELRKHLLPLLEKESKYANESKPLLVMQTRGGRYKVEVTYDEKFGSYDYVSYTNGRSSGRGHQNKTNRYDTNLIPSTMRQTDSSNNVPRRSVNYIRHRHDASK